MSSGSRLPMSLSTSGPEAPLISKGPGAWAIRHTSLIGWFQCCLIAWSGDLCSLLEGETRPCIAARLVIDADGELIAHEFQRALMRSVASLSYEEAQVALDGRPDDRTEPLRDTVLNPLQAAYSALRSARDRRQPLDLDLPEREIVLDDAGKVRSVAFKERLDVHRLIEEFMVLANVAAARTLIDGRMPLLFRVHEEPSREKMRTLQETAKARRTSLQCRHGPEYPKPQPASHRCSGNG